MRILILAKRDSAQKLVDHQSVQIGFPEPVSLGKAGVDACLVGAGARFNFERLERAVRLDRRGPLPLSTLNMF